jgi:uncharacterized protein YjiK
MRVFDEEAATDRALLVLTRESRRAQESAERVRLVIDALALRRGVVSPRKIAQERIDAE